MDLPEGTVTFLFSDVEGSTHLLERHPREMGAALARHHEIFDQVVAAHRGVIFETIGDAVYAAFAVPADAVGAAFRAQLALGAEDWGAVERIACRISLHTGEVERRGDHYFGPALFRCARLQSIGFGEQTLLSARTAEAVAGALPEGVGLRDLGEHRLKDLSEREHVFQLLHRELRETFPPPKSVDLHPNNLPLQLSSFVGREQETDAVAALLADHRLVTLTGPGGVGKTRLALQVAGQTISDHPDGAFLVDLAAVRDADQVLAVVGGTLGLNVPPGESMADGLGNYLGARRLLLVVDNVEQIPRVDEPILELLGRAPKVTALVTSRTPLHVRGERVHEVAPLEVGRDGDQPSEAVRLFLERAVDAGHFNMDGSDLETIAEISRRLDGMPLAIELAAARTTILSPVDLLARLDHRLTELTAGPSDLPERQRTLRAAIGWSYDLLDQGDQVAFGRLAIFRGSWTLEAGDAVAGAEADLLIRLLDAGLVRRDGSRFRMLETIREFAAECLVESGDRDDIAGQHARWYVDWAERVSESGSTRQFDTPELFEILRQERDNLADAMQWLLVSRDGRLARKLANRMWFYWMGTGFIKEGEDWVAMALETPPPAESGELAWLTAVLGEFPRMAGELDRAIDIKERSLRLARDAGEPSIEAAVMHDLSAIMLERLEFVRARELAEQGLAIRRELGNASGIAHGLAALAEVELRAGYPSRARELFREAAAIGYAGDVPLMHTGSAEASRRLGELDTAAGELSQAIAGVRGWDNALVIGDLLEYAAALVADGDRCSVAAALLGASERVRERSGTALSDKVMHERTRDLVRSSITPGEFIEAWERGWAMDPQDALQHALEHCSAMQGGM